MKTIILFIISVLGLFSLQAQNETQHFEVNASAYFWTPGALHFKSSDAVTQYTYPDGTIYSNGGLSGYGTSVAPGFNLKYFFNDNIGISVGLYMVHMDRELYVQTTDSTYSSYENIADIPNINLGIAGRFLESESFHLTYETGLDIIPGYGLEMGYSTESADPQDMNADGVAVGLYAKTGADFKIIKSLYFKASLMYSYIPAEVEYTNTEGSAKMNLTTDFGGVAMETGLSYLF